MIIHISFLYKKYLYKKVSKGNFNLSCFEIDPTTKLNSIFIETKDDNNKRVKIKRLRRLYSLRAVDIDRKSCMFFYQLLIYSNITGQRPQGNLYQEAVHKIDLIVDKEEKKLAEKTMESRFNTDKRAFIYRLLSDTLKRRKAKNSRTSLRDV